jgi:glycosyltransferase involved in cell wall biosynthesis
VLVAIVANLRPHKDYPTLFDAAAIACRTEPRLRFVSIGHGPLEAELRQQLAATGLGDRFEMLGYQANPSRLLAAADVFTLSSRHEGLPIALLEAMAVGLPPVVTRVGGIEEVVTDGRSGLTVEAQRPDQLAAAYVRLAQDPDLRRLLAHGASMRAEDFDIGTTARIVEARYKALCDQRSRGRRRS